MGAQILRTSDLEDLAVMVADLVTERMAATAAERAATLGNDPDRAFVSRAELRETLASAGVELPEAEQPADSADAQENGEPAQADAQSDPDPEPVAEVPAPAPAKTAKAKGKGQTDLLGLGDEEDDE